MIQDSVNKVIYEGNGEATQFFYPFVITKNTDVKVMTVSPEGAETVLTNDYYVDVEKNIVFYPGWAEGEEPENIEEYLPLNDGWRLVVYREVPFTQEVAMFDQYPFKVLEGMIDKNTILAQQLKDETDRAMRLSVSVDNSDISLIVPNGKGTSFRWSDDGKRLEVTDDPAVVRRVVENLAATVQVQSTAAVNSAKTASDAAQTAVDAKNTAVDAKAVAVNAEAKAEEYMKKAEAYKTSAESSATKASSSETAAYKSSLSASTSANTAQQASSAASKAADTASTAATTATTKASEASASAESAEASAKRAQDAADGVATGQVQADWNETDTMSKAYIKNAPRFITVSERVRGDDEPTYGVTDESFVLSDGTLADGTSVLSLDVDGTLYDVGDHYSVTTNE